MQWIFWPTKKREGTTIKLSLEFIRRIPLTSTNKYRIRLIRSLRGSIGLKLPKIEPLSHLQLWRRATCLMLTLGSMSLSNSLHLILTRLCNHLRKTNYKRLWRLSRESDHRPGLLGSQAGLKTEFLIRTFTSTCKPRKVTLTNVSGAQYAFPRSIG